MYLLLFYIGEPLLAWNERKRGVERDDDEPIL
jgi:hypothetical protein